MQVTQNAFCVLRKNTQRIAQLAIVALALGLFGQIVHAVEHDYADSLASSELCQYWHHAPAQEGSLFCDPISSVVISASEQVDSFYVIPQLLVKYIHSPIRAPPHA